MKVVIFGGGGIASGILNVLGQRYTVTILDRDDTDVSSLVRVMGVVESIKPGWIINCAGISRPNSPLGFFDEVNVNLIGAMNVAYAAGFTPQIHLASVAGLYGKPNHMGYSASKAGVISMVQSLAMEGRKAWAISPGRVDTPMRQRDYPDDTPGSRLEPWRIGNLVQEIIDGCYAPGTNIILRKEGLDRIILEEHTGDGWAETLRVGQPVTI